MDKRMVQIYECVRSSRAILRMYSSIARSHLCLKTLLRWPVWPVDRPARRLINYTHHMAVTN